MLYRIHKLFTDIHLYDKIAEKEMMLMDILLILFLSLLCIVYIFVLEVIFLKLKYFFFAANIFAEKLS